MFIRDLTYKPSTQLGNLRATTSEKRLLNHPHYPLSHDNNIRVGAYKFREQDLIGKGFSSRVYKCTSVHDNSNTTYAIKVINLKKFKNTNMLDKQIEISKQLNHPNIVKFYQFYKTHQFYYIVTQYCQDGDLSQYIKQLKKINQAQAQSILKQIIQGCLYLMRKNIIHRDLKPANIMKSGNQWKIGDFGFSTFCHQQAMFDKVNVGTPLYMPIQALKLNKYSSKSDIFALGIILHEMLTGKTPWPCKTQKQLLSKMKSVPLPKLTDIRKQKIVDFYTKSCQIEESKRMKINHLEQFLSETNSKVDTAIQEGQMFEKSTNISLRKINEEINRYSSTARCSKKSSSTKICLNQEQNQPYAYSSKPKNTPKSKWNFGKPYTPTASTIPTSIHKFGSPSSGNIKNKIKIQNISTNRNSSSKQCLSTQISQQQSDKIIYESIKAASQLKYLKLATKRPQCSEANMTQKSIFNKNTRILLNQLQFCRLMYYMIKNMRYLILSSQTLSYTFENNKLENNQVNQKMFLTLTLFKNLLRCIKQLEDPKQFFCHFLNNQTQNCYYQSKQYRSLATEIKNYAKRYEKQYLDILKNTDITIIRAVNRKFPELSYTTAFSRQFYINLIEYFQAIMRACNDQIDSNRNRQNQGLIANCLASLGSYKCNEANFQYLDSLYVLCRIIKQKKKRVYQNGKKHNQADQQSKRNSQGDIMNQLSNRIVIDYSKSKYTTQKYYELRQKINFL